MYISSTHEIRRADQIQIDEKGVPGVLLMETAGRLAAEEIHRLFSPSIHREFWILAGPGNNGGDGLVIARYLHLWGRKVQVWFSHDPSRYQGDAKVMADILTHMPVKQQVFDKDTLPQKSGDASDLRVLVDALLGTGIQSALRGNILEMIQYFGALEWPVVAIDLPSGLSADTGEKINDVLRAFSYDYLPTSQNLSLCYACCQ